ncbi:unnamed protein product [Rotaria sp. Silwood2]|nr:unnamed protein product [Rotaria sp. Silwood2]CAF3962473.1 unnamed protein product [Rotaria sp. Silwood2]
MAVILQAYVFHDLPQLYCIYVYCADVIYNQIWANSYSKIRVVCNNDDKYLLPQFAVDVTQVNIDWGNALLDAGKYDEAEKKFEKALDNLTRYVIRSDSTMVNQYADMRWGIQTESSNNHSEVQTCLHEIEMCKKYSVATNFIVLLSHRYGSRPTPATIRATLFDLLFVIIRSDLNYNDDAQLLSQWYQLDTNQIPAVYILRSISSILPKIVSSNTEEMKQAEKEWKTINNRIRNCLRQAAKKCFEQKQIEQEEYDDFFISITEKEIVKGILTTPDANQRTLYFLREIEDIREHLFDSKISKYIDMYHSKTGELIIDSEAENLLQNLKYSRIPSKLQSSNVFSYKVHWTPNGINRHDHATYIAQFNDDFYHAVKLQIDQCVKSRILFDSDPLQHEILEHTIQCRTYVNKFHGRIDILNQFKEYVMNANENRFCIAYGDSGCGKTSLLAKISIEVRIV